MSITYTPPRCAKPRPAVPPLNPRQRAHCPFCQRLQFAPCDASLALACPAMRAPDQDMCDGEAA